MRTDKKEVRALNGLRGIAALSVALGHYQIGNLVPAFVHLVWWKAPAVDLFFCLSGFTMGLAYGAGSGKRLQLRNYLVARFARIYPLYFITFVICDFIVLRSPTATHYQYRSGLRDYVSQLLMINAWPFIGTYRHYDGPSWSLSIEIFCYILVFPGLFYESARISRAGWATRLMLSSALAGLSSYLLLVHSTAMVFQCRRYFCELPEMAYLAPVLRGVAGFAAGWVVYLSFLLRDRFWLWVTRHADLVALASVVLLGVGITGLMPIELVIPAFPLLILAVSSGDSHAGRFLSSGPMHYLGDISYSIYLVHVPWSELWIWAFGVNMRLGPRGFTVDASPWLYVVLVVGLILVAALSYHAFEMPLRRMIRTAWQSTDRKAGTEVVPARKGAWSMVAAALVLAIVGAAHAGVFHPVQVPKVRVGDEIAGAPVFERAAWGGWSTRDNGGIWSVGHESSLVLRVADLDATPQTVSLAVKGSFFLYGDHRALTARITVNDIEIGAFRPTITNPDIDARLLLPAGVVRTGGLVRIRLLVDSPASPKSVGQSGDQRLLGFDLKSMKLVSDQP